MCLQSRSAIKTKFRGFKPCKSPIIPVGSLAPTKPMLFGGNDHKTYLGCLNCSVHATDSVFHEYGRSGSRYFVESIWNGDKIRTKFSARSPAANRVHRLGAHRRRSEIAHPQAPDRGHPPGAFSIWSEIRCRSFRMIPSAHCSAAAIPGVRTWTSLRPSECGLLFVCRSLD